MKELICIVCPKGCRLQVDEANNYAVTGNNCPRGAEYGKKELVNPTRTVTSTVKITGALHPRLPVKTDGELPKKLVAQAVAMLNGVEVSSPITRGTIVLGNISGTGINFVAAKDM